MKLIATTCLVALAASSITVLPKTAHADCASEIEGLLNGGAWDPFTRPARRETSVAVHPDGSTTPISDVLWDGALKSINCTPNGCFMAIGFTSWQGSSFDGPWTSLGETGSGDPQAFVEATTARFAASVSEAECLGGVDLDGAPAVMFRFFSKPEPNEYGSWWGGRYTAWIDPAANRLIRLELSQGIASWAPDPSADVQVTTIVYDDAIAIKAPE